METCTDSHVPLKRVQDFNGNTSATCYLLLDTSTDTRLLTGSVIKVISPFSLKAVFSFHSAIPLQYYKCVFFPNIGAPAGRQYTAKPAESRTSIMATFVHPLCLLIPLPLHDPLTFLKNLWLGILVPIPGPQGCMCPS